MSIPFSPRPPTLVLALSLASACVIVLGGCASVPVPTEQMAVAQAAVEQASTTGTSDGAAGELQIAIAKLKSAQLAVERKDYVAARQFAEQAEVDAQVAMLHAQTVRSQRAAQESQDAARVLREEISRKATR